MKNAFRQTNNSYRGNNKNEKVLKKKSIQIDHSKKEKNTLKKTSKKL